MAELSYASNSKANGALTTGIIGTALGAMSVLGLGSGLLGGTARGTSGNAEDEYVTRYDADKDAQIAKLEQTVALGTAEKYTDQKMIDLYERITTRLQTDEKDYQNDKANQAVINAQVAANIAVNQSNISDLQSRLAGITSTIVPITAVSPLPMMRYNAWSQPSNVANIQGA